MVRIFIISLAVNAAALWIADRFLAGFSVTGGIATYAIAGALLALLNMTVRPVVKFLSFPLIILTFGLFTIIINALMLWVTASVVSNIIIIGFGTLLWATLIVSTINMVFGTIHNS